MKIKTNGQEYACTDYRPGTSSVRFVLADAVPEALGDTVEVLRDDGFVLALQTPAAWLRWYVSGKTLVLTDVPEPEPAEPPAPEEPEIDPLTQTQLAVAELAETEAQHDLENKLAIAELAETLLGGEP